MFGGASGHSGQAWEPVEQCLVLARSLAAVVEMHSLVEAAQQLLVEHWRVLETPEPPQDFSASILRLWKRRNPALSARLRCFL
mmetsp:Transcript_110903/g.264566  ORF Transcript_110903/g.264566 Transcript_110903/m.264566 type:complete len:83 (+) Transcript_110903:453-701(+)